MTQANEVPGGDPSNAGGDGNGEQVLDKVDYRTYKKTLDQEKNLKKQLQETNARLAEFEAKQKAAEEQKLLEANQHLDVINNLKKQNEELTGKLQSVEEQKIEGRKLTSVLGLLGQKGIQLDTKYLSLIPTDEIQVDAEGRPDPTSVLKVVEGFTKEHPRLVQSLPPDLPGGKPGGTATPLTLEQWKALPYDQKKARFKDVKLPKV